MTPKRKARRSLTALAVLILAIFALNMVGVLTATGKDFGTKLETLVPKLGLDLQGGTQIILNATQANGTNATDDQLAQSVTIIRQRVTAGGASGGHVDHDRHRRR